MKVRQRPGLSVRVDREPPHEPALVSAQLLDCNRAQIQLLVAFPLQSNERVRVRVRDESSGLQLDVAGAVVAQHDYEPGSWFVTCRFDHELDWETLGELFLCGILDSAPR